MAWKEASIVDARVSFVREHATGLFSMRELCRKYGISRQTGYKWLRRQAAGESLYDRSSRPHHSPHRTPADLQQRIVAARLRHPGWGPKKIRALLVREAPELAWPSVSTMYGILKRNDLVAERRGRTRRPGPPAPPPVEPTAPNALWTVDFKGQFRMGNGRYCYPLTVCDRYSRYLLGCRGLAGTAGAPVRRVFEVLFDEFGLPWMILSDNGSPFAARPALAGLSRLSVWWMRLGIEPRTIAPGQPQQNGPHERMHRTLNAETTRPPEKHARAQQRRFDGFRVEYNHHRPHEALEQRTPAELYQPAERSMPRRLLDPCYPGHYEVRRVRDDGCIKWRGQMWFTSQALRGQAVALEEVDDGLWSLHLDRFMLARLDERHGRLVDARTIGGGSAPLALRARSADPPPKQNCQPRP